VHIKHAVVHGVEAWLNDGRQLRPENPGLALDAARIWAILGMAGNDEVALQRLQCLGMRRVFVLFPKIGNVIAALARFEGFPEIIGSAPQRTRTHTLPYRINRVAAMAEKAHLRSSHLGGTNACYSPKATTGSDTMSAVQLCYPLLLKLLIEL
jgi:hypothetical protein